MARIPDPLPNKKIRDSIDEIKSQAATPLLSAWVIAASKVDISAVELAGGRADRITTAFVTAAEELYRVNYPDFTKMKKQIAEAGDQPEVMQVIKQHYRQVWNLDPRKKPLYGTVYCPSEEQNDGIWLADLKKAKIFMEQLTATARDMRAIGIPAYPIEEDVIVKGKVTDYFNRLYIFVPNVKVTENGPTTSPIIFEKDIEGPARMLAYLTQKGLIEPNDPLIEKTFPPQIRNRAKKIDINKPLAKPSGISNYDL